ncbi:hypothetical protein [Kangiella shandongensis]|uniref:hypothetical protein n=1 Tax=Kangiella shandongensis TaxID=2763258 RepID=UPI001CBDCD74|nr:hypothetical protein [Kangiella shandongensis]
MSNHLDFDGVRLTTYTNKDASNYLHETDLFDSLFCHIKPYITPRCEIIPLAHEQIQFPVRSISSNIVAGVYSPETAFGSLCLLPNIDITTEGTPYYDELFNDDGTLSEAPPKETIEFYNRYFSLLNEISAKLRYE